MAISLKGKGKKIAISMAVVVIAMLVGGALAGGILGGNWPRYILISISSGYAVWLSRVITTDLDK